MWKICAVLLLIVAVFAEDKTLESGDVRAKLQGRSGSITLWRTGGSSVGDNSTEDTSKQISVKMDALKEVDDQGNDVGATGSIKHSFNSFASQDFTFSTLVEGDVPGSTAAATSFSFSGTLGGLTSTLKTNVYLLKEDGNMTDGTGSRELKNGMMKWSIELTSWQFCGDVVCKKGQTDEVGAFIDYTITVKGFGDDEVKDNGDNTYDIGGATMSLSNQVEIDSTWKTMPNGYPKFEKQGSKYMFTFRFEKFTTKAFYDPDILLKQGDSNGVSMPAATMSTVLAALCLSRWMAL